MVTHFWYVDMYVFNVDAHLYPPSCTLSYQLRRQMIKLSMLNIVSGKDWLQFVTRPGPCGMFLEFRVQGHTRYLGDKSAL